MRFRKLVLMDGVSEFIAGQLIITWLAPVEKWVTFIGIYDLGMISFATKEFVYFST